MSDGEDSFLPLDYLDGFVVETTDAKLDSRARSLLETDYLIVPDVELALPDSLRGQIYQNLPGHSMTWPEESGIALARQAGLTGKGVRVCVLDTGVDADHREFKGKVIDFRYIPLDPKSGPVRTCRGFDVDGHGTHVCGIIGGRNIGVAPDVELMVAAVLESETLKTSLERVVVALNWVLSMFEEDANLDKPVIVNMSLGFTRASLDRVGFESAVKAFQQILTTLVDDFHVLPVVAVGNEGPDSLRAPAYFANTLSVGAVDWDLNVAAFSGGGKSPLTGEIEPNVSGYGVNVTSSFERTIRNRSIYRSMSGTSMAAPYATGIAALVASQNPKWQGKIALAAPGTNGAAAECAGRSGRCWACAFRGGGSAMSISPSVSYDQCHPRASMGQRNGGDRTTIIDQIDAGSSWRTLSAVARPCRQATQTVGRMDRM